MNLLVVDDDIYAIKAVQQVLAEASCPFDHIYTALNIFQAKEIFSRCTVDILLCDIEMPQGTGFDLLEWMRVSEIKAQVLILTAYDNFAYAKTAIKFQCLDYLLKPVGEEELLDALKKAKQHCQAEAQTAKQQMQDYKVREEQFILNTARNIYGSDRTSLLTAMTQEGLSLDLEHRYLTGIFSVKKWAEDVKKGDGNLLNRLKSDIADNLWEGKEVKAVILNFTMILILVEYHDKQYEKMAFAIACRRFIEDFRARARSRLSVCVGEPVYLWQLGEMKQRLIELDEKNVMVNHVSVLEQTVPAKDFKMPELESWQYMLEKGYFSKLEESILELLKRLELELNLNAETLFMVQQNFLQTVYTYVDTQNMKGADLFNVSVLQQKESNALKNTDDFMEFIQYILQKLSQELVMDQSQNAVDIAVSYIEAHLTEKISCNELGKMCYLNPDYLTRCFKKIKGMSVTSYITKCRMEKAKMLLEDTKMPVSRIASQAGYDNYTHFVKTFEKYIGMTPQEYHKMNYHGS